MMTMLQQINDFLAERGLDRVDVVHSVPSTIHAALHDYQKVSQTAFGVYIIMLC